jgi:hypothetical protein
MDLFKIVVVTAFVLILIFAVIKSCKKEYIEGDGEPLIPAPRYDHDDMIDSMIYLTHSKNYHSLPPLKNLSKEKLPDNQSIPGVLCFTIDDNGPDEITVYNRAGEPTTIQGYETSKGIDIDTLQAPNVASK